MLVFTRRLNEQVVIGDRIVVQVSRIAGNRVRLAIAAPDDVKIRRGELGPLPARRAVPRADLANEAMRLYDLADEGRRHLRDQLEDLREENRRLLEELAAAEERLEAVGSHASRLTPQACEACR